MRNLKNNTNGSILNVETDLQTKQTYDYQKNDGAGETNGIDRYKLLFIK